jgi:hypothetical protein
VSGSVGRGRVLSFALSTVAVALTLCVPGAAVAAPSDGLRVTEVRSDPAMQSQWERYGDTGGGWTGADSTYSVPLPDGRDVWLFSDTFLGPVGADHTRPLTAPFIHNSMVVESHHRLTTVTGGTVTHPESLVGPTPSGPPTDPSTQNSSWYWSGDGTVEGNRLRVFYLRFVATGSGSFDFRWDSTAIATFSLPDLKLLSLTPTYGGGGVTWGSALLEDGGWTYVYGIEDLGAGKYMHLARARTGDLLGAWQFWTGSGWSSDPASSTRLMDGVSNEYSVSKVDDEYVLVTMDTSVPLGREIVAYTSASPTGPFANRMHVYDTPETGGNIFTYNAHAHPELSRGGNLVVSYNVNSFDVHDVYRDVRDYRARFLDVRLSRADRP